MQTSARILLQVIIDLGRRPEARFLGVSGGEYLRQGEVSSFQSADHVSAFTSTQFK